MTVKVLDEYSGYEPVLNHVVYTSTRGTSIVPLVYTYPPPPSKKKK